LNTEKVSTSHAEFSSGCGIFFRSTIRKMLRGKTFQLQRQNFTFIFMALHVEYFSALR